MFQIKEFLLDDDGNVTVGLSIIFPILILFMLFTEQQWQAHYIRVETQAILDFATLGAAETGEAKTTQGQAYCVIPYDESNQLYSGNHVSKYLIKENMHVLPTQMQEQLLNEMAGNKMEGLANWELQQTGYMNLEVNLRYRVPLNLFYSQYTFHIESTSRCQPDLSQ